MEKEKGLRENIFNPLSLGAIKAKGWLKQQLQIQARGLTGHVDEIWEDLGPNNQWLGGEKDGWERGPYYADGLIALAYLLDDKELINKSMTWVEAFLSHQSQDGWIGTEKPGEDKDHWPVFIVMKVLSQYYEVSGDKRVIRAMTRFFRYLDQNIDREKLFSWAKFRWADLVISIQWLYQRTEEDFLLSLSAKLKEQGYNWQEHFTNFQYKKKDNRIKHETHVVNNAMGLKTPAIWYKHSGSDYDLKAVYKGLANLDKFHGQVTGVFSGDEHLSGKSPSQGTELCAVVEYMFSLEKMIAVLGDSLLADQLEKITFNALPATFTADMCAHQYDQQVNQVICNVAERDWTNDPDANIFGLEPNFGCCTANMHQGWPKYVKHLWMKTEEKGLAAICYSPCQVSTIIAHKKVSIIEETDYPFKDKITFKMELTEPVTFPLSLRIPSWAKEAEIKLSDGQIIRPDAGSFYKIKREWSSGDVVELVLPMEVKVERRYNGAISITRGPLIYSLKLEEEWKLIDGTPPFGDWEVYPTTNWNYGLLIDLNQPEQFVDVNIRSVGKVPFSNQEAPVEIKIKGKYLNNWQLKKNSAAPIPLSPVRSDNKLEELTLIPYGCTNLRITEFPLLIE